MDGVLVHEGQLIPGADAFLGALAAGGHPFLVLTGNVNLIWPHRDHQKWPHL